MEKAGAARCVIACTVSIAAAALAIGSSPAAAALEPLTGIASQLVLFVCVAAGIYVVASTKVSTRAAAMTVAVLAGVYLMTSAALILSGSSFGPLGAGLDQSFRTAYVTKLAANWGPTDLGYQGLPWSYPPTYFWVLGRAASVFDVPAWQMLKVGLLAVAAIAPVATTVLWSRLVSWPAAAAVGVSTLIVQEWYEPYEWLAAVVFIPWAITVWQLERHERGRLVAYSLLGAFLVSTYGGFLPVAVVLFVGTLIVSKWIPDVAPRDLRAVGAVAGGSLVCSAWYWGPLLASAIFRGTWDMLQDRWYDPGLVGTPLPFLSFDLRGFVLLGGLAYLVVRRGERVARLLLGLLAAAYIWYGLGYVAVLFGSTLLAFKTSFLISVILATAAGLGAIELLRSQAGQRRVLATVLAGTAIFAFAQAAPKSIPFVEEQRKERYPAAMLAAYVDQTGHRDETVLSDVIALDLYLPNVYLFNVWNANYANPVAGFTDRSTFIQALGHETDPLVMALVLNENRYERIDRVVFHHNSVDYWYVDDNFPRSVTSQTVTFDLTALASLDRTDTPDLTIYTVPHRHLLAPGCDVLVKAIARYGPHLAERVHDQAATCPA